eukprot:c52178_g1_i1.p1 GENE.c52178_g1_i1~~c52178_g1_i1.p1  ORF type:complete len:200 (+),score=24.60 c52178_g1_i1:45-644(+)
MWSSRPADNISSWAPMEPELSDVLETNFNRNKLQFDFIGSGLSVDLERMLMRTLDGRLFALKSPKNERRRSIGPPTPQPRPNDAPKPQSHVSRPPVENYTQQQYPPFNHVPSSYQFPQIDQGNPQLQQVMYFLSDSNKWVMFPPATLNALRAEYFRGNKSPHFVLQHSGRSVEYVLDFDRKVQINLETRKERAVYFCFP